jgi:hypothetical protein
MASALRCLGWRRGVAGHEEISYADLGVEQLGAVYERVLDLGPDPSSNTPARRRAHTAAHSAARKRSGTFYTPQPLADFVVRRTLAPLVAGATADGILSLRVLDPAMGSGAFLVAACRYLAAAYERALIAEGRVSAADIDEDERAGLRRLVAERCLAGVDVNATAVQLARLSLWLTTLARGKPLSFLDHRLRVGNSLIGAAPDDLARTRPAARGPAAALPLFDATALAMTLGAVVRPLGALRFRPDDTIEDVRAKEAAWQGLSGARSPLRRWRTAADVWCARWFVHPSGTPASSPSELGATIDAVLHDDRTLPASLLAQRLHQADAAARAHGFFHWPLEFADLFYDEHGAPLSDPGFDVVIGNPPWQVLRNDDVPAGERTAEDDVSGRQMVRFLRESGVYPLCDRGHVNLYQPFVERSLSLLRAGGRAGFILPWGLAVDDGPATLRRTLIEQGRLHTVVGLDNARALFPFHRGLRFLVAVVGPRAPAEATRGRFGLTTADEIEALPEREDGARPTAYPVRWQAADLRRVGGRTLRIPDVRRPGDASLLRRLMQAWPALGEGAWLARFGRELNATEDRAHFGARGLPVLDGKHLEPFRARAHAPPRRILPSTARRLLPDRRFEHARLGYRDVSSVSNKWSLIAAVVPAGVVTTHTIFCLRSPATRDAMDFLCAIFNSFVINALVRMLMGGHLTTSLVESLPVPPLTAGRRDRRIVRLSQRLRTGRASEGTTARLQAEIARLYGVAPTDFRALLDGFPLVPVADRTRAAAILETL